jgi:hypothetical protein
MVIPQTGDILTEETGQEALIQQEALGHILPIEVTILEDIIILTMGSTIEIVIIGKIQMMAL